MDPFGSLCWHCNLCGREHACSGCLSCRLPNRCAGGGLPWAYAFLVPGGWGRRGFAASNVLPLSEYMAVSSHSAVKVRPFSPAFPLTESKVKAFCRHFFGASRKKAPAIFMAQPCFLITPPSSGCFLCILGQGRRNVVKAIWKKGLTVYQYNGNAFTLKIRFRVRKAGVRWKA